MASGYITSDDKDLDERYLAINGKAKSAKMADKVSDLIYNKITGFLIEIKYEIPMKVGGLKESYFKKKRQTLKFSPFGFDGANFIYTIIPIKLT